MLVPCSVAVEFLHIGERFALKPGSSENGRGLIPFTRLAEGEIDPVILGVFGMKDKIVEAGVRAGIDFGHSADGLGIQHAIPNDAKRSLALAHKNVAAGEKGHAERLAESLR